MGRDSRLSNLFWRCLLYSQRLEAGLFYHTNNKFKASPVLNIIPFPSPLRRGLGRGLPEGFHIWLNY
jgi:hypothetical protein